MHGIFFALLMTFSLVVVATAAPMHSARIAIVPQEMASKHVSLHSVAHTVPASCQTYGACGASESLCDFICSGNATWLTRGQPVNAIDPVAVTLMLPETPNVEGHGPKRTERPPDDGLTENTYRAVRTLA